MWTEVDHIFATATAQAVPFLALHPECARERTHRSDPVSEMGDRGDTAQMRAVRDPVSQRVSSKRRVTDR